MIHPCTIPGCTGIRVTRHLMCRACWSLVPIPLQRALGRTMSLAAKRTAIRAAREAREAQQARAARQTKGGEQ